MTFQMRLSEKDTILVQRLTLPKDFTLSQKELSLILEGNSHTEKNNQQKDKSSHGKDTLKMYPQH